MPGIAAPILAALTQFAVGGLWAQTLVPLTGVPRSFFAVCSLTLLAVEGIVLWVLGAGTDGRWTALPPRGGALLAAAFGVSLLAYLVALGVGGERGVRLVRAGALALGGGLLALRAWEGRAGLGPLGFPLLLGNAALGAALPGLAFVGMLLGHAYLNAPHLPLRLIERVSRAFLWAVLARGGYPILAAALLWLGGGAAVEGALAGLQEYLLVVILRLGVGVGGSLTVALIIRNCLRLPNVQAATGFYYVAMLTVCLGEVLGRFLLAHANLPL
ncbi:MAG: hypothetical protein HYY54_08135 [candidate division NC10 bacterium]|nr:hypothetical protein [candidate division NC10 bacterium]